MPYIHDIHTLFSCHQRGEGGGGGGVYTMKIKLSNRVELFTLDMP